MTMATHYDKIGSMRWKMPYVRVCSDGKKKEDYQLRKKEGDNESQGN